MPNTKKMQCEVFIKALASKSPTPGGGGAAAFGGAIGMALASMVGNLTVSKKKYALVEDEVKKLIIESDAIIDELMDLIDKDAVNFEPLSKAYRLPEDTAAQIKHKTTIIEQCSKNACLIPIAIIHKAYDGIMIHQRMSEIGNLMAISDIGCGVVFLKAALIAAKLNVLTNFNFIKDLKYIAVTKREIQKLCTEGCAIADKTLELVISKISK